MKAKRHTFTPEQKVAFLRLNLLENKPVSDICEEHGIAVNLFHQWQKEFFENGAAAFENTRESHKTDQDYKDYTIADLQEKLQKKDEVLSDWREEHLQLKNGFGEL